MLNESFPPDRKRQTRARYSPDVGAVTAATSCASRRLSIVLRTERELTAAQLAWPRKRRRESGFVFMLTENVEIGRRGDEINCHAQSLAVPLPGRGGNA